MLGQILNLKNLIQKNGMLRPLKLLKVAIMLLLNKVTDSNLLKDQPQLFQITTTESMPGLMPNTRKTTQLNGLLRPKLKLTVLMMLLCKDPLQLLLITTTE